MVILFKFYIKKKTFLFNDLFSVKKIVNKYILNVQFRFN